jgi:hypothetical protein
LPSSPLLAAYFARSAVSWARSSLGILRSASASMPMLSTLTLSLSAIWSP